MSLTNNRALISCAEIVSVDGDYRVIRFCHIRDIGRESRRARGLEIIGVSDVYIGNIVNNKTTGRFIFITLPCNADVFAHVRIFRLYRFAVREFVLEYCAEITVCNGSLIAVVVDNFHRRRNSVGFERCAVRDFDHNRRHTLQRLFDFERHGKHRAFIGKHRTRCARRGDQSNRFQAVFPVGVRELKNRIGSKSVTGGIRAFRRQFC